MTCSIATGAVTALAGGIATVSAMLGASVVAIALGEMCVVACVVAFTLLIWAAIQDGKQADRAAVE